MKAIRRIRSYWNGRWYSPPIDSNDRLIFIGYMVYPWPRRLWNAVAAHWGKNWQFWMGGLIAVVTAWAFG